MRRLLAVAAVYFVLVGLLVLLTLPAGAQGTKTTCAITQTGPGTYNVTVANMGDAANLIYESTVTDPTGYGTTTLVSAYGTNGTTFTYGGAFTVPGTYTVQILDGMGHGLNSAGPWYTFFKWSNGGTCSATLS